MKKKISKNNLINIVKSHFLSHIKEYVSLSIILLIGIIMGVVAVNTGHEEQRNEIINYINDFLKNLKDNGNIDTTGLLLKILLNNIYFVLLIWFVGSTVIGIPIIYGIIAYRGFSLGYTISSSILALGTAKGTCFSLSSLLPQNLIYIPCILALAVSGIKLYKSIIKKRRRENIKIEILKHTFFSIFIGALFLIGGLIETYVSTRLISIFVITI